MEKFWNYIHYCIYSLYLYSLYLYSYVDPLKLLYKIPLFKKIYKKNGVDDINTFIDNTIKDPKDGFSSTWASIQMGGILVLLEFSLFNIFQAFLGRSLIQYIFGSGFYLIIFLIGSLIIPGIINYNLLWKKDKYLFYFESFHKQTKKKKKKWVLITFLFIISVIFFLIFTFYLYSYYCFPKSS